MDIINKLNAELHRQDFAVASQSQELLEKYLRIAEGYALIENSIAVLSDMSSDRSWIYYGALAEIMGLDASCARIDSIWEKDILDRLHPEDLNSKHLQELRFFHFMKRQGADGCFHLAHKLRMKDASGEYIPILHRQFYVRMPEDNSLRLALCLYNPLTFDMPVNCMVVNTISGESFPLEQFSGSKILSKREKEVLQLIDRGLRSHDIADHLSISKYTVSRHRQEILAKLQVKNSIEACRVAKALGII